MANVSPRAILHRSSILSWLRLTGFAALTGGGGNNILVGDGNEEITGGSGFNLIISGGGGTLARRGSALVFIPKVKSVPAKEIRRQASQGSA